MNDYPATLHRKTITDNDRVYPGNGVAPLIQTVADLQCLAPGTVLSLERFTSAYWKGDSLDTAKTGLANMKAAVRVALRPVQMGAKS